MIESIAIPIVTWCLGVFFVGTCVGGIGQRIFYKRLKRDRSTWADNWYDVFTGLFYISFTIFILALIGRFVLVCVESIK